MGKEAKEEREENPFFSRFPGETLTTYVSRLLLREITQKIFTFDSSSIISTWAIYTYIGIKFFRYYL